VSHSELNSNTSTEKLKLKSTPEKMGSTITIKNDSDKSASGVILDIVEGGIVMGWDFTIDVGESFTQNCKGLTVGNPYKLILRTGKTMELVMEDNEKCLEFYAFPIPREGLRLLVSEIKDSSVLKNFELEYLCQKILPLVRIEDRVSAIGTYNKSFIASELVSYLQLHGVAKDDNAAVEKCNVLQEAGIIIPYHSGAFSNSGRYYKLNVEHEILKELGALKNLPSNGIRSHSHLRFYEFGPLSRDTKGLEGWLEKKSKLGYWQKRFFRVLDDEKIGLHMAYFENTTSLCSRGQIPLKFMKMVQMTDPRNFVFTIAMKPRSGHKSYAIRAPTKEACEEWLDELKYYAPRLSPYDVVRSSPLGFVMNEEMIYNFVKLLKSKIVKKDSWICKRGDKVEDFYLLREGTMGIYVRTKEGKDQFYCKQQPVSVLGESLFIRQAGPHAPSKASCKAMEECELLVLTKKNRKAFLSQYPGVAGQLHNLFQSSINSLIENIAIFKELSPADIAKLKMGFCYRTLKKGEKLFYEGDIGGEFYIVYSGSLTILQHDNQAQKDRTLNVINKSQYFGELALMLDGIPRTATVVATQPTCLLSLKKETFQAFLKMAKMEQSVFMRQRIVNTFKTYDIPFFEAIPQEAYDDLAKEAEVETFEKDKVIFRERDVGDKFYIVSFGEVAITVEGKLIKKLKQGKFFGEIALVVEDTPRTATITTTRPTVLLSMHKSSFAKFFEEKPEALADVQLKIAGKKCQLRSVIYHPNGNQLFTQFLKSQYADESIEYWEKVRKFRKWAAEKDLTDSSEMKMVQESASKIVTRYIRPDAEMKVNISNKMTQKIISAVDAGQADAMTFAESEEEIVTLMSRDKLGSFKQSKVLHEQK